MIPSRLLAVFLVCGALFAQTAEWHPFEMIWRVEDPSQVAADMSFLLDAPAGRNGFARIEQGHLADGAGKRLRLWGVNFSFTASLPDKETAPLVAAHLARFGVNSVRVHHLDWRAPRGIIDSTHPDSRHLDPDKLDRLDYLIAELKKRGIYTNLNLNVARAFQEADGVKDAGRLGFAKALTLFDERMIELQQEYARQLLAHRNPYTGNTYAEEPAIVIVEIVNENSIIESWLRGRLLGKGPQPGAADATWVDITESYEQDLTALYQTFLAKNARPTDLALIRNEAGVGGTDQVPRLRPDQFKEASALRFQTEAAFYIGIETRFYDRMRAFLKNELGVKVPLIGTSAHAGSISPYPLLVSTSRLDIIDAHVYWQHPSYFIDPETKRRGFTIRNTPMVNEPEKSTVVTLNRAVIVGKPFIASEVNHPYPSEYSAEGIPILAAYAAFQDWDGIYWYSFEHNEAANWVPKYPSHFDIRQDPVKMSQLALGALLFLRGDVYPATRWITRSYSPEQVLESLRLPSSEAPNFTPGMPPGLALRHGSRIQSLDGRPTGRMPSVRAPFVSDTGQLRWDLIRGKGIVSIDTPRSQGWIGFVRERDVKLANLAAEFETEFAAVLLASLDGKPIAESSRLLLTAGSRTSNTGAQWNEQRTSLRETGGPPMLIQPVKGNILLVNIGKATRVEALPLDGAGRPLGPFISGQKTLSGFRLPLGEYATPWYLIRLERE